MFGNLERQIIQTVPIMLHFSSVGSYGQPNTIVIHDNIDRFFIATDEQTPLQWIKEIQDHERNIYTNIQNNGRVANIVYSKRDAAWKETPADIDTATQFDLEKFRKDYFDKMDFISNFK